MRVHVDVLGLTTKPGVQVPPYLNYSIDNIIIQQRSEYAG